MNQCCRRAMLGECAKMRRWIEQGRKFAYIRWSPLRNLSKACEPGWIHDVVRSDALPSLNSAATSISSSAAIRSSRHVIHRPMEPS